MPTKDTSEIKNKIINIIRVRGPCLPVHIAKGIGMDILFTSAFLSELISENRIKISHMKVGSSSVHYIIGQELRLENFSQYLKSREKDAYRLLKEKKFLKDSEQEPAIRVALRAIKDFAIPINKNNIITWRYFTASESELPPEPRKEIKQEIKEPEKEKKPEKKVEIFGSSKENIEKKPKESIKKSAPSQKKNEKFFNKIKEFLSGKSVEILDIEGFSKTDLTLKIRINEKERLLVAYNKKRITEQDIINANKKASELNLKYIILSLGEPLKKTTNLIEAIQNLAGIEKIE